MRGVFVQHPLEYRLEVQGDTFVQGASVPCVLLVRNHGEVPVTLSLPVIQLAVANLKKVKSRDLSGFDDVSTAELERGVEVAAKGEVSFKHSFSLDINAPITDKSQTLYLLYGGCQDKSGLGQLALTVSPHPHIRAIFDTFTSVCSFVAKGETSKDSWTYARLIPPESRRMSFVEELTVAIKNSSEGIDIKYLFTVKKFETSMTKVDVKKGKTEVRQSWSRTEFLFGGDFLNQPYVEKMIEAALSEVSSGL